MRLRGRRVRVGGLVAVVVVVAAVVVIWGRPRAEPLRILAVPELGDLRPVLEEFTRETGVPVELLVEEHARIARRVAGARPDFDAVWSHTDPESGRRVLGAGTVVMSSPVLLGLRESLAEDFGWTEGVTWERLVRVARDRDFTFGMSSPESSFSGRAVVLSAATGLSGAVGALSARDVYPAAGGLHGLSTAQDSTAPTDGGLAEGFLRERGEKVDGLFTYESEIARLNASGRLAERLVPVRPDGAVAARYTLRPLLEPRTREAGERLSRLTGLLLAGDTQRRIAELTHRRPGAPGVEPPGALAGPVLRPLDVPEDQYVVNRLVDAYLGRYRYDARMLFLLNVSGSMRGVRLERLREAAVRLAGAPLADTPAVGDMHLIFVPFGARPGELRQIRLSGWAPANAEGEVRALMGGLVPRGEAAIYDALVAGYRELGGFHEEDRVVSVILITDGSNGRGRDLDGFLRHRAALAPGLRAVPVYPVLVGGAGESEMRELADRTGGRVLDARGESLAEEFLTARAGR